MSLDPVLVNWTADAGDIHRPRLLNLNLEYLTGYREKHKDAPTTAGFVSLDFRGVCGRPRMILPVSTVCLRVSIQPVYTDQRRRKRKSPSSPPSRENSSSSSPS